MDQSSLEFLGTAVQHKASPFYLEASANRWPDGDNESNPGNYATSLCAN